MRKIFAFLLSGCLISQNVMARDGQMVPNDLVQVAPPAASIANYKKTKLIDGLSQNDSKEVFEYIEFWINEKIAAKEQGDQERATFAQNILNDLGMNRLYEILQAADNRPQAEQKDLAKLLVKTGLGEIVAKYVEIQESEKKSNVVSRFTPLVAGAALWLGIAGLREEAIIERVVEGVKGEGEPYIGNSWRALVGQVAVALHEQFKDKTYAFAGWMKSAAEKLMDMTGWAVDKKYEDMSKATNFYNQVKRLLEIKGDANLPENVVKKAGNDYLEARRMAGKLFDALSKPKFLLAYVHPDKFKSQGESLEKAAGDLTTAFEKIYSKDKAHDISPTLGSYALGPVLKANVWKTVEISVATAAVAFITYKIYSWVKESNAEKQRRELLEEDLPRQFSQTVRGLLEKGRQGIDDMQKAAIDGTPMTMHKPAQRSTASIWGERALFIGALAAIAWQMRSLYHMLLPGSWTFAPVGGGSGGDSDNEELTLDPSENGKSEQTSELNLEGID